MTLAVQPGSWAAWRLAARPATLPAAVVPVAVGSALGLRVDAFDPVLALGALFCAVCLQVAANLANDVFDFERGADGPERTGPPRAAALGLLSTTALRRALLLVLLAAAGVGSGLVWVGGPVIAAIGVGGMVAAVAYTAGPWPLAYHGLGDLFVLGFFGFAAVGGTEYLMTGAVSALGWWCAAAVGSSATALLVVNNLRDRKNDARVGKRTLAVRLGRRGTLLEHGLFLTIAAIPLALLFDASNPLALGLLAFAPLAWLRVRALRRAHDGPTFNRCLAATGRLMAAHGALLVLALLA